MGNLITVFTPTYNRLKTLPRLYNSLKEQTSSNFEWLIVDDGSDDGTEEYINNIKHEEKFHIRYLWQKNQGKHVAFNRGVMEANGELFFCVDSDDYLINDAIKIIEDQYSDEYDNIDLGGMVFYRKYESGDIIGTEFPEGMKHSRLEDIYLNGKTGDTALIYRTSILKCHPFPVFEGERFLRESIIWKEIDKEYVLKVVREAVYVTEYLDDGLTKNSYYYDYKYPQGAALYRLVMFKGARTVKEKIGYAGSYIFYKRVANERKDSVNSIGWLYFIIGFPISLLYCYRVRKALKGRF